MRLIAVAVPVPTLDALTYSVPESLPMPVIGARVLVPLGNRTLTGIVVDVPDAGPAQAAAPEREVLQPEGASAEGEPGTPNEPRTRNPEPRTATEPGTPNSEPGTRNPEPGTRPILEVLDDTPFLPADVVRLASWVANYYASGAGEAMATAMPPRAWIESERYAQITEAGEARLLTERGVRRRVLEALSGAKPVRMDALIGKATVTASVKRAGATGSSRSAVNVAQTAVESHPRGSHAVLIGLERDGLVRITQPLKGSADAHRTARVVTLTAQGHDAIEPDDTAALVGVRVGASE